MVGFYIIIFDVYVVVFALDYAVGRFFESVEFKLRLSYLLSFVKNNPLFCVNCNRYNTILCAVIFAYFQKKKKFSICY